MRLVGRIVVLAALATAVGCRRKHAPSEQSAPSGSSVAASVDAGSFSLRFERFVDARVRDGGEIDVAGVTRDNRVVLATFTRDLALVRSTVLVDAFTATEETAIALASSKVVVVTGRVAEKSGVFVLRENAEPRPIDAEWCLCAGGVAWLARDNGKAVVQFLRGDPAPIDAASGAISAPAETETHLRCGPDAMVVAVGDGETLALSRLRPGALSFGSPQSIVLEKSSDFADELRERFVVPRAGDDVVVVRVGESHVALREVSGRDATPTAWTTIQNLRMDGDTDVIDVAASPTTGSAVAMLTSEAVHGTHCDGGDAARRIVMHSLEPGARESRRPIVELACGVEAISAHLATDSAGAHLWWTEPVADGSCAHPGLAVSAVIEADGQRAGARRTPIVAEGVTRLSDGRFLAVVRDGGCAPYQAPGSGVLAFVTTPR